MHHQFCIPYHPGSSERWGIHFCDVTFEIQTNIAKDGNRERKGLSDMQTTGLGTQYSILPKASRLIMLIFGVDRCILVVHLEDMKTVYISDPLRSFQSSTYTEDHSIRRVYTELK